MSEKKPDRQLTPVAIPRGPAAPPTGGWKLVADVAQDAPGFTKAWYVHRDADLFTWSDEKGIASFQFCFGKQDAEQMIAWDRDKFVAAGSVDTGESSPVKNNSPIMRAADARTARAPTEWLCVKAGLPDEVVQFVEHALGWGQSRGATDTYRFPRS